MFLALTANLPASRTTGINFTYEIRCSTREGILWFQAKRTKAYGPKENALDRGPGGGGPG